MSATSRVAARKLDPPHCFAVLAALALTFFLAAPAASASGGSLDVATLRVRLHDTPAIGLVTKLRLKSDIEHLVDDLAAFHAGRAEDTIDRLHARYRSLVARVVGLLQQGDAALARELDASTENVWAELTDPRRFATLASS